MASHFVPFRLRRPRVAAVIGLLLMGRGTAAAAQASSQGAQWLDVARGAQRDFERARAERLPWAATGSGGGRCDARIGRFCYWHATTADSAPPEPAAVRTARTLLLAVLDSAARALPASDWLAGQRVRYLVEAGQPDSAARALSPCAAAGWWCDALRGFAEHAAGRDTTAMQSFHAALSEMPDGLRCQWLDLTPLLTGALASQYRSAGCGERPALDARLWWLAEPFQSRRGNEREAEHYARLTMARIASQAAWPEVAFWGDDLAELMVRYGWSRWFERRRPSGISDPSYSVVGHDPQPSYAFIPSEHAFHDPWHADPSDWDLEASDAGTRYAPRGVRRLARVHARFSRFLRGDSQVVVAAWDAHTDSVLARVPVSAALVVSSDEDSRWVSHAIGSGGAGAIMATAPSRDVVVSVEMFADSGGVAGRVRQGLPAIALRADGLGLSDLLLFRNGPQPPTTLGDAAPRALAELLPGQNRSVGLYWELYDRDLNTALATNVSLTVRRTGTSWWRRARRVFGLGAADAPITLRWQDMSHFSNGVQGRSVGLDLSRLERGTYQVHLEVRVLGHPPMVAERQLEIAR